MLKRHFVKISLFLSICVFFASYSTDGEEGRLERRYKKRHASVTFISLQIDHLYSLHFAKLQRAKQSKKIEQVYRSYIAMSLTFLLVAVIAIDAGLVHSSSVPNSIIRTGNEVWCRLNDGISRCVDAEVKMNEMPSETRVILGQKKWCPFRICGPSYTQTDECAQGEFAPLGKCSVRTIRSVVNECLPSTQPRVVSESVACPSFGKKYCNMGAAFLCQCKTKVKVQTLYYFVRPATPRC